MWQKVKGSSELTPCADFDVKCCAEQSPSLPSGHLITRGQSLQVPDEWWGLQFDVTLGRFGTKVLGEMRLGRSPKRGRQEGQRGAWCRSHS